ncbi:DNA polymerase III subunit epsilon [Gracilaria domingensis]|nr:DNA polymerase III subunit epsilon [Gracilaria domingensis]
MELECTSPSSAPLSFSSLVHPPGKRAPRAANRVHGITNQMMQDAPSFEKVWEGILEYVQHVCHQRGRPIFVAHNLSFDHRFLKQELSRIGEPMPDWDFACSLRDVARIIWPGHSASLASLCKLLRIRNEEAHRALSDVETTSKVLAKADEHLRNLSVRMGNGDAKVGSQIRHMIENAAMNRRESTIPEKESPDRTMTEGEPKEKLAQSAAMMTRSMAAKMEEMSLQEDREDVEAHNLSNQFSSIVRIVERKASGEEDRLQSKYVTRMGTLWHASRNCQYLDLAVNIRKVTAVPPNLRPCVLCVSNVRETSISRQ